MLVIVHQPVFVFMELLLIKILKKYYMKKGKTFLDFFHGDPNNYPNRFIYLGLEYTSMKDDETKKQFQERIENEIKRLLPETKDFGTFEESYYNG